MSVPLGGEGSGSARWDDAARPLEQATRAGLQEAPALLMLALAYKHLGRVGDARQTLSRIPSPDAAVLLQRGFLAFRDKAFAQAGDDFQQALDCDGTSYSAAYNLFLSRVMANQLDRSCTALSIAQRLAPSTEERGFLGLVHSLLQTMPGAAPTAGAPPLDVGPQLVAMSDADEQRLLELLAGLSRFEVAYPLLSRLVAARPRSTAAFRLMFVSVLVQAKQFLDKNQWEEAKILLAPIRRRIEPYRETLDPYLLIALYQMLGVCSAMLQDFEQAVAWFRLAHDICQRETARDPAAERQFNCQGVPQLAWAEQNLALVHEWLNRPQQAEAHWKRYLDLLEKNQARSKPSDHLSGLAFECLIRLSDQAQKAERWDDAIRHLQGAHKFRPTDYDTLEKLFNLFTQLRRSDEARKMLRRMREVRPDDPNVELFELDVREARSIEEIERALQDLRRVAQKHPGDMRVDERVRASLHHLMPAFDKLAEQYSGQIHKVVDQMRRLPSYQVNWPVVRDVMHDMEENFRELRRVAQKMLAMANADDQRRDLQKLMTLCDRKIDQCASLSR